MSKLKEIEQEITLITEIYFSAKENFNYSYYFNHPSSTEELAFVNKDSHIKYIRHSLWRIAIIELAKLFSTRNSTDKLNLLHFLSKFKSDAHYGNLEIDQLKLAEWETVIYSAQKVIDNILKLRDKIYAHTVREKEHLNEIEFYFKDLHDLFDLIKNIIVEVNLVALKKDVDLRTPIFETRKFYLIKDAIDGKRHRIGKT